LGQGAEVDFRFHGIGARSPEWFGEFKPFRAFPLFVGFFSELET